VEVPELPRIRPELFQGQTVVHALPIPLSTIQDRAGS
jgi:hypothetical protein